MKYIYLAELLSIFIAYTWISYKFILFEGKRITFLWYFIGATIPIAVTVCIFKGSYSDVWSIALVYACLNTEKWMKMTMEKYYWKKYNKLKLATVIVAMLTVAHAIPLLMIIFLNHIIY